MIAGLIEVIGRALIVAAGIAIILWLAGCTSMVKVNCGEMPDDDSDETGLFFKHGRPDKIGCPPPCETA